MLDRDYIDQMGKKYDYFTYNIKFKKHAFLQTTRKGGGSGGYVRPYSGDNYLLLHSELHKKGWTHQYENIAPSHKVKKVEGWN